MDYIWWRSGKNKRQLSYSRKWVPSLQKMFNPPPLGPPSTERPQKRRILLGAQDVYPANLVSIASRVSDIWIKQYFPFDLNVKIQPPPQGPPWADHPRTNSFPSLVFALPWAKISRRLHHPALRYPQPYKQTKKNSKLNITPKRYAVWRDKKTRFFSSPGW